MNEVEKMMQNANIKQDRMCEWTCKGNEFCSTNCVHYESIQLYYPPFTAEKQIELIKWLARKGLLQINYSSHQCYQFNSFRVGGDYKTDISEALASHCNNLWQDLTEEERKQIKNILESEVRE